MPNNTKVTFLKELRHRFGNLQKFTGSLSLYRIEGNNVRLYIRYSRTHSGGRTWYGLREKDLQQLEGHPSILCFLWDGQIEPLLVPYSDYEEVFQSTTPAEDGQYKVQIILQEDATELYIARAGRFNVEGYFGWTQLERLTNNSSSTNVPDLSHSQVQTLLGSIGAIKNFDVWIPQIDRSRLDWGIATQFSSRDFLPYGFEQVHDILGEIDVIWLQRGANDIRALFEVEHSTPVYSGLLRFNDIHLAIPNLRPRFSVVSNNERRSLFIKQLNRPTFRMSGLVDICTFLEYTDVFNWHQLIARRRTDA